LPLRANGSSIGGLEITQHRDIRDMLNALKSIDASACDFHNSDAASYTLVVDQANGKSLYLPLVFESNPQVRSSKKWLIAIQKLTN
jgi:hypothetical protein